MKILFRQFLPKAALLSGLVFALAAPAQEAPPATPKSADAPSAAAEGNAPADAPPPASPVPGAGGLRRLDRPSNGSARSGGNRNSRNIASGNSHVAIGHDVHVAPDEIADVAVAVFGSATSEGDVHDAIVSILGDTRATGPVGDAAVAVLGSTYVNNRVGDNVVAVLGNVELGPEAEVGGDVVAVGGRVIRDARAVVHGEVNNVSIGGGFSDVAWLRAWFRECLLYGRLLAFKPDLGWAWGVALVVLGFYIFLALLFRAGVEKCLETIETRPGYSVLTALFAVLLTPVAIVLLVLTGVGVFLVPLVVAGMFFAALFGKVVMLGWLGRKLTRFFGEGPLGHIAVAVLAGGLVLLGLYTVPVLGILLFKLLAWVGMGAVVYTLLLGMKRDKPPLPPGAPAAPASAVAAGDPALPAAAPPPVAAGSTLPRAGFWIRMAALLLDVILVAIICEFLSNIFPHGSHVQIHASLLPVLAIYGAVMWKLRGSTIGGIIFGLKVVRLDDRAIDWGTAIARALGCFLSLVVAGLGFIWVTFDGQRQSWHDKIAGTTVVRMPRGMSLVN